MTTDDPMTDRPDDTPVDWVLQAWVRDALTATGDASDTMTKAEMMTSLVGWLSLAGQQREVAGISRGVLRERAKSTVLRMHESVHWSQYHKALVGVRERRAGDNNV